jgi:hypothetical protein
VLERLKIHEAQGRTPTAGPPQSPVLHVKGVSPGSLLLLRMKVLSVWKEQSANAIQLSRYPLFAVSGGWRFLQAMTSLLIEIIN